MLGVMEQWSIGVMEKQTDHNLQALIQHSSTPSLQIIIRLWQRADQRFKVNSGK
jgi:hypothetical protein